VESSPQALRTTALALSYSAAEHACLVWERSTRAKRLDPALNESCRLITGCFKPTATSNLYLLAGIASPKMRMQQTIDENIIFWKNFAEYIKSHPPTQNVINE